MIIKIKKFNDYNLLNFAKLFEKNEL